MSENGPFFIVGSGRSGTTLLRLILASHSRIEIPPETWFLLPLVERLPLTTPLTPAQVEQAVAIITSNYRWPDMGIEAGAFAGWARALPAPRLADVMGLIYDHHLRLSDKPRFGDKTPPYIAILPQLSEVYPDAKFIHLIRDGRDVAMSFLDAHFAGAAWAADFEWTRAVRLGLAGRGSPLAERILDVRYEDLVLDLEPTVRRICAFLGEAFEPAMLCWREAIDRKVPMRERVIHKSLSRPVSAEAVNAWRSRLSLAEQFATECCIQPELAALGYELRFRARAWRPALGLGRVLLPRIGPQLRRVIQGLRRRGLLERQIYL